MLVLVFSCFFIQSKRYFFCPSTLSQFFLKERLKKRKSRGKEIVSKILSNKKKIKNSELGLDLRLVTFKQLCLFPIKSPWINFLTLGCGFDLDQTPLMMMIYVYSDLVTWVLRDYDPFEPEAGQLDSFLNDKYLDPSISSGSYSSASTKRHLLLSKI
ncbi:hypothetical protein BpHYR1_015735 [Brachionus plicatilis]|uniref:Uncharacterized protein n=1 Tax=Brachionus plicatilis TaxID=10195 RepID=A0A3M7RKP5_BRAPC|nr:hypothetical protein BpHYR1_015735 [Brachionus plicatilis]